MKIIVLNLPRNMIKEELAELFKNYGEVESVDLVMDKVNGTSKGFGFVEMPDNTEATASIKALHGKKIGANIIRVKQAEK